MSKKRTSAESKDDDDQKNEDSESDAKRARLCPVSDTTLQDLPLGLLQYILVKDVVMEVKGMKLAKSVWKDKAKLVISRLKTVSSTWNSILASKSFQADLHRTLDSTALDSIRLEILHQSPISSTIEKITTLNDDIFMLVGPEDEGVIAVYNRNNLAVSTEIISNGSKLRKSSITIGCLNVGGLGITTPHKTDAVKELLTSQTYDVFGMVETWHLKETDAKIQKICPVTYLCKEISRKKSAIRPKPKDGGGVLIAYKQMYEVAVLSLKRPPTTFEILACDIRMHDTDWSIITLYRRPLADSPHISETSFRRNFRIQFEELLSEFEYKNNIVVMGDFNIWFNEAASKFTRKFDDILFKYNFVRNVSWPTYRSGSAIDEILTKNTSNKPLHISVFSSRLFDHCLITATLNKTYEISDLQREVLEYILVKAVTMEVKDLKLAKSVWKDKAELVMSRLKTVSSLWSSILASKSFQADLHRALDSTAMGSIRLEILHQSPISSTIEQIATLNDVIFMLGGPENEDGVITVYNRNNLAVATDTIPPPPGVDLISIAACHTSNCLYVGLQDRSILFFSVVRISKVAEHQFTGSPCISNHNRQITTISVVSDGRIIILSWMEDGDQDVVSIYDVTGILLHETKLSPDIGLFVHDVIEKLSGNLVLPYISSEPDQIKDGGFLEIDAAGTVVGQHTSPLGVEISVSSVGLHRRLMITESDGTIDFLDSEFNHMNRYQVEQDKGQNLEIYTLHFDSQRNEILRIHHDVNTDADTLTIFRVAED